MNTGQARSAYQLVLISGEEGSVKTSVLEDLGLQRLDVVHAGDRTFPLSARIRAVALRRADPDLARLA